MGDFTFIFVSITLELNPVFVGRMFDIRILDNIVPIVQWSLLNGVTVNGIIRLIGPTFLGIQGLFGLNTVSQAKCVFDNGIIWLLESLCLGPKVQCNYIKRAPLYCRNPYEASLI
jgi:hypothetical protein